MSAAADSADHPLQHGFLRREPDRGPANLMVYWLAEMKDKLRSGEAQCGNPADFRRLRRSNGAIKQAPKIGWFRRLAHATAEFAGCPACFFAAVLLIIGWGLTGPLFHFSDTWQLVINTATTVITFLMVFLIQNTQNRDAKAIHLKLDELIHSIKGARNSLVALENLSDEELAELQKQFERLHEKSVRKKTNGRAQRTG